METKSEKPPYATHSDLNIFRREVREDMSGFKSDMDQFRTDVRGDMSTFFTEIRDTLQARLKPRETNWSVIWGGLSLVLVLAGMAGALINGAIKGEANLRQASDISQITLNNKLHELDAQLLMGQEKYFQAHVDHIDNNMIETRTRLDRIDEKIAAASSNLDTILQREMRLLDEVLQREMNLHVSRLEDLIDTNKESISLINSSRFTQMEGERLSRDIDIISAEQRRRTEKVYSTP